MSFFTLFSILCIFSCMSYPVTEGWCTDFNMKQLQFLTGTSCNMYRIPAYTLPSCGQLCIRINKCQYFTGVDSDCFLCIDESANIQNVSEVLLNKLPLAPSWDNEKLIYHKADAQDHCTSGCVNGNCLLHSDDVTWKCHCHVNYTGVDCAESVNKVPVFAVDETPVNQKTAKEFCLSTTGSSLINMVSTDVIKSLEGVLSGSNCWNFWTSAELVSGSSVWQWADGTEVDSQLWASGYPTSDSGATCVAFEKGQKKLGNRWCTDGYCALCQD